MSPPATLREPLADVRNAVAPPAAILSKPTAPAQAATGLPAAAAASYGPPTASLPPTAMPSPPPETVDLTAHSAPLHPQATYATVPPATFGSASSFGAAPGVNGALEAPNATFAQAAPPFAFDGTAPLSGFARPASAGPPAYGPLPSAPTGYVAPQRWEAPEKFDKATIKKLVDNHNMSADAEEEAATPEALTVTLMRHQKRAVAWMLKRETQPAADVGEDGGGVDDDEDEVEREACFGGLLCDEQGLGKTLTTLAVMAANPPPDGGKWRSLIVCPVSLVGQWKAEIETRVREEVRPSVYIYHGAKRIRDPDALAEFDVIITTYTTLAKEYPKVLKSDPNYAELAKAKAPLPRRDAGPLFRCSFYRVVLDEAHTIKNMKTENFAAACALPAQIRWCLTGTPIQNSVDDIYSLFIFLRYRFMNRMTMATWKTFWKSKLESNYRGTRDRSFKRFQPVVAAVTLRRTKLDQIDGENLIELPPKFTEVKAVDFRFPEEALKYQELKKNSHSELERLKAAAGGIGKNYAGVMVLLLRLRQACCHPFLAEYAASKQRGWNGSGDTSFVSQYSAAQLDDAQLLVDSGVSVFDRLSESVKETLTQTLAAPMDAEELPKPELDFVKCAKCEADGECSSSRFHLTEGIFCQGCYESAKSDPARNITDDNDPFLELDDVRREVHANARSARAAERTSSRVSKNRDLADVDPRALLPSTKLSIIVETVEAMRDRDPAEKCLIFSQWTSFLDIISFHLKDAGFKFCRLDGTMNLAQRKEQVAKFQSDSSCSVFLLSMMAAGTGLNLTEASNVILADSWWNTAVEAQCCDRAHRIGQTRPVHITRIKMVSTCEERIFELCARKAETSSSALGDSGGKSSGRKKMTLADALALFGDENETVHIPSAAPVVSGEALDSLENALGGMKLGR